MELISWSANILAVIGWVVNIKYRKHAMIVFTVATVLSIVYFVSTKQMPFLYRFVLYLIIDVVTLWNIFREERLLTQRAPDLGQAVANDDNVDVAPSG